MTDSSQTQTTIVGIAQAVTQAIYDELQGPIEDCDRGRQKRDWELSVRLAQVALAKVAEIANG